MRAIIILMCLMALPGVSVSQVQPIRLSDAPMFGDLNSLADSLRIYVYTTDFVERERIVTVLEKAPYLNIVNRREESDLTLGFLSSTRPLNMRLDMWSSVIAGSYGQQLNGTRSTLTKEIYGSMAAFTLDEATGDMTIFWYQNEQSTNPAKDCTRKLIKDWEKILKLRGTSGGAKK